MTEMFVPLVEQEGKTPPVEPANVPLITTLGLVEGEVLTVLEAHGATTARGLVQELEWPAWMVVMAVGALIRERLVRATPRELELIVEPVSEAAKHAEPWRA